MAGAEWLQPATVAVAALTGLAAGALTPLGGSPAWVVEVLLVALLLVLFLSVDPGRVRDAFSDRRFTLSAVALNFVFTPILSLVLGFVFLRGSMDLRIGLTMLLVTPCTDWYLVFTRLGGGNVALGLSILPLNLVLQVLLLPVYLALFFGEAADLDIVGLLSGMALMLAVPLVLAAAIRAMVPRGRIEEFLGVRGDGLQSALLCLAVFVMFASQGEAAVGSTGMLIGMFLPLAVFFVLLFHLSRFVGGSEGFPRENTVSLQFTTMARNSPLALAIAVAAFPDMPLVPLALVIGPLIELPVLSVAAWFARRWTPDPPPRDGGITARRVPCTGRPGCRRSRPPGRFRACRRPLRCRPCTGCASRYRPQGSPASPESRRGNGARPR